MTNDRGPRRKRSDNIDVGIPWTVKPLDGLTVGYQQRPSTSWAENYLDKGQFRFGAPVFQTAFNYSRTAQKLRGFELLPNYDKGPGRSTANLAWSAGQRDQTSNSAQFNFDQARLQTTSPATGSCADHNPVWDRSAGCRLRLQQVEKATGQPRPPPISLYGATALRQTLR
jgi:hypothetical protein